MDERRSFAARFHSSFSLLMIALYLLAGISLVASPAFSTLPFTNRKLVGGILILYGVYRFYKWFRKDRIKATREENNEG